LLNIDELKSVIGHELAHYHLWERDGGEFQIADRLLNAIANDPRASSSHEQSARRYQLYTEIFADRGSLWVTGDLNPVVTGLVKIQTGLSQVSATSYLSQAEEIFSTTGVITEGLSHPEAFIRTRALTLWKEQQPGATAGISAMIEGSATFDDLDLIGQRRLASATRLLLQCLLRPKWFQTATTLAHARLFFPDFQLSSTTSSVIDDGLKFSDPKLREYLCYVLLDFTKVDPDLDEIPLAAALELSRKLDLDAPFEKLAAKELKMKIRDVRKLKDQAAELLAKTEVRDE
jgi:hypothetical protein